MEYAFEIIPNEQTPKVEKHDIPEKEVLNAFLEFAKSQPTAVGLAANQCSLNGKRFEHRIFAMKNIETREWELIVDPILQGYRGIKKKKLEGCLTWKGRNIVAERYYGVDVAYYDKEGSFYTALIFGFQAQIFQHEYNHIQGVPEEVVEVDYQLPPPIKIQRNEPCPCGSGLKHKNCCLKYESIF